MLHIFNDVKTTITQLMVMTQNGSDESEILICCSPSSAY